MSEFKKYRVVITATWVYEALAETHAEALQEAREEMRLYNSGAAVSAVKVKEVKAR